LDRGLSKRSFFFFSSRRRHTRSKRDWSSDVCSSDLLPRSAGRRRCSPPRRRPALRGRARRDSRARSSTRPRVPRSPSGRGTECEIGRASCRERGGGSVGGGGGEKKE